MSLFQQLGNVGGFQPQQQQAQPAGAMQGRMQLMQQVRNDPAGMLRNAGYNVPQGMTDPQQLINHLTQSGQVTQNLLAQLMMRAGLR